MRDAEFDVSFRDCLAKGGTGGHPMAEAFYLSQFLREEIEINHYELQIE
jgi:hypothetical protein